MHKWSLKVAKWRLQAGQSTASAGQNESRYIPFFTAWGTSTTEAQVQRKFYTAYTVSALRANVTAIAGTGTVAFRDDGVSSSNQSLSVTTTGWQEDVTGTDTTAADSLCNWVIIGGGSHGNSISVNYVLMTYEHASINSPLVGGSDTATQSTDLFYAVTNGDGDGAEAAAKTRLFRSVAASSLRAYLTTASASGLTVAIGKNGVSSTNVSVTPSSTGAIEDTTGTESFASGDDANLRAIRTANSWVIAALQAQLDTEAGIMGAHSETGYGATTREYEHFGGIASNSTTADDNRTVRSGAITVANWQCYLSTNGSGTRDATVRVVSTDSTNLTISLTATGHYEDVTGSESVGDTDHLGWSLAAGTTIVIRQVALEAPWVATAAAFEPRGRPYGNVGAQQMAQLIVQ